MKVRYTILTILLTVFAFGCGVQQQTTTTTTTNKSIIGSWQGCDGRVVTFTQKGDSILGHYSQLKGVERFGFTKDEIAYKLIKEGPGSYSGQVKWREVNIKEPTWRAVKVAIDGNTYKDEGSDRCGRDMTRVTK